MNIYLLFLWFLVLKGDTFTTSAYNENFLLVGGNRYANTGGSTIFNRIEAMSNGNSHEVTSITTNLWSHQGQIIKHQPAMAENYKQMEYNGESLRNKPLSLNNPQEASVREYKDPLRNQYSNRKSAQIENLNASLMRCEINLTNSQNVLKTLNNQIAANARQIQDKDATLNSCEIVLNTTQDDLRVCKNQLGTQNIIISKHAAQLKDMEANLKNCKLSLNLTQQQRNTNSAIFYSNSNVNHNDKIPNFKTFPVLSIDGWTIIQQRIDGKENFARNWEEYKNGFGLFTGDFFLGLEKIHRLVNEQPHEFIIHLETFNGINYYARYKNFKIAGEDDKYKLLSLGSFSGNATWNGMKRLVGQQFSTIDSDNDAWMEGSCAHERQAGWWFRKCALSNPNGKYYQEETYEETSDWWNMYYSLKTIHMAIRPKQT